jgi:hypothetical protein
VRSIGRRRRLHPDFGSDRSYGIPYDVVRRTQRRVPIRLTAYGDDPPLTASGLGYGSSGGSRVTVKSHPGRGAESADTPADTPSRPPTPSRQSGREPRGRP